MLLRMRLTRRSFNIAALGLPSAGFTPPLKADEWVGTFTLKAAAAAPGFAKVGPMATNLWLFNALNVPEEGIAKTAKSDRTLFRQVIPPNTYKGVDKENITVGTTTIIGCAPTLSEDVVYRIFKTILTHKE